MQRPKNSPAAVSLRALWSSFWRRLRHGTRRRQPPVRLRLERLEDRLTPSYGLSTLASFATNGISGLVMDSSGNLYGTMVNGGDAGDGLIFELAKGSSTVATLASFNGSNGAHPFAGLVMDASGNLYGTTYLGGASNQGTVFELANGSGTITALASFDGNDGANPYAGLVLDGAANLYGTTVNGGASGDGTVFELASGSSSITTLAPFNGTNGANPFAGLILDGNNNLYGTASAGGAAKDGTVFEVANGSGTITTLSSFNGANGATPYAALVMDSSNNLYGTTTTGGVSSQGTVFEVANGSAAITTLASFNGSNGAVPYANLIIDGTDDLYGTTYSGGTSNDGTVFEVASGSGTISTLASFNGSNGASSNAGLIMDTAGNLYGTTREGGVSNFDTVFEVPNNSGTIQILASFCGTTGSDPSGLVMDANGNLFGVTQYGGPADEGTIFELPKGSGSLVTIASFNGSNGVYPDSGLILDGSGNLYGTSADGIFEFARGSSTIVSLASFDGSEIWPNNLTLDSHGDLFGTMQRGGPSDDGSLFELVKGSDTVTTLVSFNGSNGARPNMTLVMDANGNLYGSTTAGGAFDDGTVFELPAGSNSITTLASFDNGPRASSPQGTMVLDSAGNLYGTTAAGGSFYDGTVFELAKGSSTIVTVVDFIDTNAESPSSGLVMDGSGNLYGTTGWSLAAVPVTQLFGPLV